MQNKANKNRNVRICNAKFETLVFCNFYQDKRGVDLALEGGLSTVRNA